MNIQLISEPWSRTLHGLSGKVENQNYGGVGVPLMDAMWQEIRDKGFQHEGINHWVYDQQDLLFVGVELETASETVTTLERKDILLPKYAYWKHVGAYTKLPEIHDKLHKVLKDRSINPCRPSVEVYGHWTEDEAKLETEVLIRVE